jgi:hypothetical protein
MFKERKYLYFILTGILVLVYLLVVAGRRADLFIYESGSYDILHAVDAYSKTYVDGFHYYYSTLFAFIIYPLSLLPMYLGNLVWLLLNAVLLFRIIILTSRYFDLTVLSQKQKIYFLLLTLLFGVRFIYSNFQTQQITILILYLVLEGLAFIFSGRKITGAALIAVGINIKLLPVIILPYLIYRKEFKAFFMVVFFYAVMLFLPGFVLGFQQNNILISSWWRLINPTNPIHVLDVDETSFHSLSTLLATLLVEKVPDKYALPVRRNIADISYTQLEYILNTVRFILIAFTLYFLRTKPFVTRISKLHRFYEISYLLLLVPLIFPHQQDYAFLFIVPAVSCIIYYLFTQGNKISKTRFILIVFFLVISYLACNLSLLFGEYREYYAHFKILTYGAILVIPLLALSYPLKHPNADK